MTINMDEIEKALEELSMGGDHTYFRIHAPEWLRLLVERVRELESDKEMAEADASHFCAGLCVHPRGVIGDDGGSACCPITGTRDALVDGKKVVL